MAKLTHSQRCKYEEYGSINVDMTDERKTILDYKILTPAIKKDFIEIMKFAFSDTAGKMQWNDTKYSSNQYFVFSDDKVRLVTQFKGHRLQLNRTRSSVIIFSVNYGEIVSYSNRERNRTFDKIRDILHDYCESKLNFEARTDHDYRYNSTYRKNSTIQSDLQHTLNQIIPDGGITISKYVFPGKPYNLKLGRKDGMVEYNQYGKVIEMKIGKGIKKFFKIHGQILSDETVKEISNRLNLKVSDFKLKIVEGKDIDKYYYTDSYDDSFDIGSLGSSCMRGDDAQDGDFFEVYKDHAKMIILHNEDSDMIIGRAILWEARCEEDEEDEGLTIGDNVLIMDRIYSNESVYSIFKDWAKANGYYRKRYQSFNNEKLWRSPKTGDEVELEFSMPINLNQYDNVPYMDTFAWGDREVVRNDEDYGWFSARSTEGILEGGDNESRYDEDDYDEDEDDCIW